MFALLGATLYFTSCSSDSDLTFPNNNNEAVKYDVALAVKGKAFSVEKEPFSKGVLRNDVASQQGPGFKIRKLDILAYEAATGKPALTKVVKVEDDTKALIDLNQEDVDKNTYDFVLELPKGDYNIVVIGTYYYAADFLPSNFNEDKVLPFAYPSSIAPDGTQYYAKNMNVYYACKQISVNPTASSTSQLEEIELKPMWSTVELKLSGLTTAKVPENSAGLKANYLKPIYKNHYYGFAVKDGLAYDFGNINYWHFDALAPFSPNSLAFVELANNDEESRMYVVMKGANRTFGFDFESYNFPTKGSENGGTIIDTKSITIDTNEQFENGYSYVIKCDLSKVYGNPDPDQRLTLSLGKFQTEDQVLEYNK